MNRQSLMRLIHLLPDFSTMATLEQQSWWFEAWLELYRMTAQVLEKEGV